MKCKITDIAKDTHLSTATVSKYMNGIKIRPENAQKIKESIERLQYTPNRQAQLLRSRKNKNILVLLPTIADYSLGKICNSIEEFLRNNGYTTMISSYAAKTEDYQSIYQKLTGTLFSGVIIFASTPEIVCIAQKFEERDVPCVFLNMFSQKMKYDTVTSDMYQSAFRATVYLIKRGHQILGLIGNMENSFKTSEYIIGFKDACKKYGILPMHQKIMISDEGHMNVRHFQDEIETSAQPPTAVISMDYRTTIEVIQHLAETGISIPEDISLISIEDDEIFSGFAPPVTSLAHNTKELGTRAAEILIKRMEERGTVSHEVELIPMIFRERMSVRIVEERGYVTEG